MYDWIKGSSNDIPKFKLAIRNGLDNRYVSRSGSISASSEVVLLEETSSFILDYFEWSTNSINAQVIFEFNTDNGWQPVGLVNRSGSSIIGMRVADMELYGFGIFEVEHYDKTSNEFKFKMRNPFYFTKGARIKLRNNHSSSSINIAACGWGRIVP